MKLLMAVLGFLFFSLSAFADTNSDNIAKKVIDYYVLAKNFNPNLTVPQLCTLSGQAKVGFALLQSKSDKEIAALLTIAKEEGISSIRETIAADQQACN